MFCTCRRPDIWTSSGFDSCLSCGLEVCPRSQIADNGAATEEANVSPSDGVYSYTNLGHRGKQFRLLILQSQVYGNELCGELVRADLETDLDYEAVSYTWADQTGNSSLSEKIWISGKPLPITPNCAAVLRRFRRANARRILFIDAICIHQSNIQERNTQVLLMKDIYSKASRVVIYAGESSDHSDKLLDYLSNMAISSPNSAMSYGGGPQGYQLVADLQAFLSRPWFHRIWILQEVLLAKRAILVAGDKSVNWWALSPMRLQELSLKPALKDGLVPGIYRWTQSHVEAFDVLQALHAGRNCLSTDPRDKLYALLGLVDNVTRETVTPNYEWPTEEVFIYIAMYTILRRNALDVVAYAGGEQLVSNLPSWCPDWSAQSYTEPLPAQFTGLDSWSSDGSFTITNYTLSPGFGEGPFSSLNTAAYVVQGSIRNPEDPIFSNDTILRSLYNLEVYATSLGTIQNLLNDVYLFKFRTQPGAINVHQSEWESFSPEVKSKCKRLLEDQYGVSEPALGTSYELDTECVHTCIKKLAFFNTLGGYYHSLNADTYDYSSLDYPKLFDDDTPCNCKNCSSRLSCIWCTELRWVDRQGLPIGCPGSSVQGREHTLTGYKEGFLNVFMQYWNDNKTAREMFMTDQSLGVGPRYAQLGDTIWYLQGAKVPFVLREIGDQYKVVGECYLFGAEGLIARNKPQIITLQ